MTSTKSVGRPTKQAPIKGDMKSVKLSDIGRGAEIRPYLNDEFFKAKGIPEDKRNYKSIDNLLKGRKDALSKRRKELFAGEEDVKMIQGKMNKKANAGEDDAEYAKLKLDKRKKEKYLERLRENIYALENFDTYSEYKKNVGQSKKLKERLTSSEDEVKPPRRGGTLEAKQQLIEAQRAEKLAKAQEKAQEKAKSKEEAKAMKTGQTLRNRINRQLNAKNDDVGLQLLALGIYKTGNKFYQIRASDGKPQVVATASQMKSQKLANYNAGGVLLKPDGKTAYLPAEIEASEGLQIVNNYFRGIIRGDRSYKEKLEKVFKTKIKGFKVIPLTKEQKAEKLAREQLKAQFMAKYPEGNIKQSFN